MYSLYIKFQEKIFTGKKIIQLWNFGNFDMLDIIPKILVTLKFSKISVHELKGCSKFFQMMYWPHFYVDPSHSNTYFLKVGKWRVSLQGTVPSWIFNHSYYRMSFPLLYIFDREVSSDHWILFSHFFFTNQFSKNCYFSINLKKIVIWKDFLAKKAEKTFINLKNFKKF